MTTSTTLFTEFVASRVPNPSSLPLREESQLNLFLIGDLIKSATQQILAGHLLEAEELWLIDLLDALQMEKERIEAKLSGPVKYEDARPGWHLHLRSQSGFELPE